MPRRTPRIVQDTHKPHSDCLIDAVATAIPHDLQSAWKRGLEWRPRVSGWELSFEQALDSVRQGIRPLLYGWSNDQLIRSGLEIIDMGWISVAFPSINRDLAELMAWGHIKGGMVEHVVNGVVLGYPLDAVEHWINCGCPGPTMLEVLQNSPPQN